MLPFLLAIGDGTKQQIPSWLAKNSYPWLSRCALEHAYVTKNRSVRGAVAK